MVRKNKNFILGVFAFSLALFMFSSISASTNMTSSNITINAPVNGGTMNGALAYFNCSFNSTYNDQNWSTANIYLYSAGLTSNTSQSIVITVKNTTNTQQFNGTLDSTKFEDGNDYIFTCQLYNGTAYLNASTTGVIVDNTIPQVPVISPADQTEQRNAGTYNFSAVVVDKNTTSCTYTFYKFNSPSDQDSSSGSTSYTVDSCSFTKTFTNQNDEGTYYWTITASDGTNSTQSATNTYKFIYGNGNGGTEQPINYVDNEGNTVVVGGSNTQTNNTTTLVIAVIFVVLVILFIIYVL